jgi:drug/metabolite transporter (DMT)-like permease
MAYLIIVSIIWSLSFSLIKGSLTSLDSNFVAFVRLAISFLVFLPFLRLKKNSKKLFFHFFFIGIIQYGFMYLAYIYSYQFLKAYEIAILTIFTPIFVVIIFDLWIKKLVFLHWIKALLAIIGAGIIVYTDTTAIGFWKGIALIQISNLLFAFGQVYYKKIIEMDSTSDHKSNYAIIFMGAVFVTGIFSFTTTDFNELVISTEQWITLLYLGTVASGLGFFLWNIGATKVEAGTLAVMNNLKIPLGVIFAFLILAESVNLFQLFFGTIIILLALKVNEKKLNTE